MSKENNSSNKENEATVESAKELKSRLANKLLRTFNANIKGVLEKDTGSAAEGFKVN